MALPFFYSKECDGTQQKIVLDEETSKHAVQVLRMKVGEQLNLTDGKGNLLTCEITEANKKRCRIEVKATSNQQPASRKVSIAISLLKNANRFEWFLEKATEIGVSEIIPLLCERTEKEKFRYERMQGICISAMLQSQQVWLPLLHEPMDFNKVVGEVFSGQKFIAHCTEGDKRSLHYHQTDRLTNCQILIGPEGDFTKNEIERALLNDFIPVALGETRLRAETAGIVAVALLITG